MKRTVPASPTHAQRKPLVIEGPGQSVDWRAGLGLPMSVWAHDPEAKQIARDDRARRGVTA